VVGRGKKKVTQIYQLRYFFEGVNQLQSIYSKKGDKKEEVGLSHGFDEEDSFTTTIKKKAMNIYSFNTKKISHIGNLVAYTGTGIDNDIHGIGITEYRSVKALKKEFKQK